MKIEQDQTPDQIPVNPEDPGEFRALQARLEAAHARLADKDAMIADLRADRDHWRQQATALLDHTPSAGFLKRLFGR